MSRFDGSYEHVFETTTAGVTIQAPQLDVSTVAGKKKKTFWKFIFTKYFVINTIFFVAGGGSILTFRSGLFAAGPESAGAHPGPVKFDFPAKKSISRDFFFIFESFRQIHF